MELSSDTPELVADSKDVEVALTADPSSLEPTDVTEMELPPPPPIDPKSLAAICLQANRPPGFRSTAKADDPTDRQTIKEK